VEDLVDDRRGAYFSEELLGDVYKTPVVEGRGVVALPLAGAE